MVVQMDVNHFSIQGEFLGSKAINFPGYMGIVATIMDTGTPERRIFTMAGGVVGQSRPRLLQVGGRTLVKGLG